MMKRRNFLANILSFCAGLTFLPGTVMAALREYLDTLTVVKGKQEYRLPYVLRWGQPYISLADFAHKLNLGIFTNKEKRKTVIYIGKDKAKFTADNTFLVLNDVLYQLRYPALWLDGEVWVSASEMAEMFDRFTAQTMSFRPDKMVLSLGRKDVNISGIGVQEKENGTLIHIYTEKSFSRKDVALKATNGWLYVEIWGARVDPKVLSRKQRQGLVSEIQAIQFDQSASLAFKLNGKFKSKDVLIDPENSDILVTLRTDPATGRKEEKKNSDELEKQKQDWMIHTIVIDAGHGGKDPGAIGYKGLKEKDIVLPVALKLGQFLKKRLPDVRIVYTRDRDVFIPLWKRTKIANENNGKLFVSLHCNSNRNHKVRGFETYFLSAEKDERARDVVLKENEAIKFESQTDQKRYEGVNFVLATLAQNAFIKYSQYLATVVQKSLAKNLSRLDMKSRGVKQGPFWVMVGATMPNILIEMGFISNKHEAILLKRKATQTRIAQAITEGIVKYKTDVESAL